jgi:hypothetical protein
MDTSEAAAAVDDAGSGSVCHPADFSRQFEMLASQQQPLVGSTGTRGGKMRRADRASKLNTRLQHQTVSHNTDEIRLR